MKQKFLLLILCAFGAIGMNAQCPASFTYSSNPNGSVTFNAGSLNSPSTTYSWTFGNGTAGWGNPVSTVYNSVGPHIVCLTVTDTLTNCTSTWCDSVFSGTSTIGCNANFTSSPAPVSSVLLTSVGAGSNITNYYWYDASGVFATSANASYTNTPGTHNICLVVEDTNTPCRDTFCSNVTIGANFPCQASFYIYPDSNAGPHTYVGVNTSVSNVIFGITTYTWTWGDGTSSTGQFPSHTYASAGSYNICLIMSNSAANCIDTFCYAATINKNTAMVTINFQAPASVNEPVSNIASLHPNPSTEFLIVQGKDGEVLNVEIYSLSGQKIKTLNAKTNQKINTQSLPKGIYLLKATNTTGKNQYAKFVKE